MMNSFDEPYKSINCPQCGAPLPLYFAHTKLTQCQSCGSSIFLEDEEARSAGFSSVLAPEPSLIKLHQPFSISSKSYMPLGMIRYSYGRGFWEEWWIKDSDNEEYWLSVDEGDMVLEQQRDNLDDPKIFKSAYIGHVVGAGWMVTEIGVGRCEGFSGSLPRGIIEGQEHKYIHLSGSGVLLKTLELDTAGMRTYVGRWIDPFDIKVGL
ncbi:hypothetical protein MNB_SV-6-1069 [hydrothermal vent metagenome]|uniref:DUF4178 domain-containing protein n=1 Tax=hydrothermal vent metagenome TaxID=652676 RepID=A0A1W1B8X6_9ZZZZ